ncbi:MAG: hypothetical protein CW691_07325 [Candidatus Bathyarchaeum sp.]|nr:MAG: hypothetical protein CW691_07325 [Candidatus Bathyarchaeum sp.]
MPWEQTQKFIRSGHTNPEDFDSETFKTITLNEEEGIQAITGKPLDKEATEIVTYLFSKEKSWTIQKAQEWLKEHEKKAKESFSWTGTIKNIPQTGNLIRGKALHPIRTVHPQEWPQIREYLKEELEKSAHTLAGTPLILDHQTPLKGRVLGAEYEDGAIEYVAQLDDPAITKQISDGTIRHCSVEFEWKTLEKLNGHAPRGIKFTGLSLLKDYQPGDPQTTVELWEAIINGLKDSETKMKEQASLQQQLFFYPITECAAFMDEHFSLVWIDQTNGIQGIYGLLRDKPENPQPMALMFMKDKRWTIEKMEEWLSSHPQYVQAQPEKPPIEQPQPELEAAKPLGEAIISPSESNQSELIPKQEVLSLLPEDWIVRAWSIGPQLLVRQLRHKLASQSTDVTGSRQG